MSGIPHVSLNVVYHDIHCVPTTFLRVLQLFCDSSPRFLLRSSSLLPDITPRDDHKVHVLMSLYNNVIVPGAGRVEATEREHERD